jgi:dihydroflavonol-4-reductase
MKVLVTGATGLLGNTTVRLLLERGAAVRTLVRRTSDPRPLQGLPVERFTGDVLDPPSLPPAIQGADLVVHCAGLVQVGLKDQGQHAVNVEGARSVSRVCRMLGVRMVHVSSVDALRWGTREDPADEDEPQEGLGTRLPYSASKRLGEEAVLQEVEEGLDAVIVNPGYLLGPWDWKPSSGRMLLEVARGLGLLAPGGGNDFCHAGDVAAGLLAAGERGVTGRRYILGGEALSYREAWTLFARITGGRPPLATAPDLLVRATGLGGTLLGRLTGREPAVNSGAAAVSLLPHHFSSRRAERELGYRWRPAEDAAREAWEWFRAEGYA